MVRTFRAEMTVKTAMTLASCLEPEAYPEGEPWREVALVLAKEVCRLRAERSSAAWFLKRLDEMK